MEDITSQLAQYGPLALLFGLFLLGVYRLADKALVYLRDVETLRTQASLANAEANQARAQADIAQAEARMHEGVETRRGLDEVGILLRRVIQDIEGRDNG